MSAGSLSLSGRLRMLGCMVTTGSRLADVGCDHGFLSIYLVQEGICPRALAMDVRSGPLAGARQHVEAFGLGDYIETRLSDGLARYQAGEADALVCAGMGGRLMERILTQDMDKAKGMRELILQPQSEIGRFRAFLREAGFAVTEEDAVCEEGKYYFAMKAVPGKPAGGCGAAEEYDLFGEHLLKGRHPVLFRYLGQRKAYLERLASSLEGAGSGRAGERLAQVRAELGQIGHGLSYYG